MFYRLIMYFSPKIYIKIGEGDIKKIISLMLFPNKSDSENNRLKKTFQINKKIKAKMFSISSKKYGADGSVEHKIK